MAALPLAPFLEVSARAAAASPASKWRVVLGSPNKSRASSKIVVAGTSSLLVDAGNPVAGDRTVTMEARATMSETSETDVSLVPSVGLETGPPNLQHAVETPDRVYALVEPPPQETPPFSSAPSALPHSSAAAALASANDGSLKNSVAFMLVQTLRPPTPDTVSTLAADADADDVPPETGNGAGAAPGLDDACTLALPADPPQPALVGSRPTSAAAAVAAFAARRALTAPPDDPVRVIVPPATDFARAVAQAPTAVTEKRPSNRVQAHSTSIAAPPAPGPTLDAPLATGRNGASVVVAHSPGGHASSTDHRLECQRTPIYATSASVSDILSPHFDLYAEAGNGGGRSALPPRSFRADSPRGLLPSVSTFITKSSDMLQHHTMNDTGGFLGLRETRAAALSAASDNPPTIPSTPKPALHSTSSTRRKSHTAARSGTTEERAQTVPPDDNSSAHVRSPVQSKRSFRFEAAPPASQAPSASPAVALLSLPRLRPYESQWPRGPFHVRELLPHFVSPASNAGDAGNVNSSVDTDGANAFAAPLRVLERWVEGARVVVAHAEERSDCLPIEPSVTSETNSCAERGSHSAQSSSPAVTEPSASLGNASDAGFLHYSPRFGTSLVDLRRLPLSSSELLPPATAQSAVTVLSAHVDELAACSIEQERSDFERPDSVAATAECEPVMPPTESAGVIGEESHAVDVSESEVDAIVRQLLSFPATEAAPPIPLADFTLRRRRLSSTRFHLPVSPLSQPSSSSRAVIEDVGQRSVPTMSPVVPLLEMESGSMPRTASLSPPSQNASAMPSASVGTLPRARSINARRFGGASERGVARRRRQAEKQSEPRHTCRQPPPEVTAVLPLHRELSRDEIAAARAAALTSEALARSLHERAAAAGYGGTARGGDLPGDLSGRRHGGAGTARGAPSARSAVNTVLAQPPPSRSSPLTDRRLPVSSALPPRESLRSSYSRSVAGASQLPRLVG